MRIRVTLVSLLIIASTPGGMGRAKPGAKQEAFRIDLGVTDPAGLDLLPGISEGEVAAIAAIAGPGSGDLGERLSETGLPRERLCRWAPYMVVPESWDLAQSWVVRSSVRGTGREALESAARISVGAGAVRGSCRMREMPERVDLIGWISTVTPAWEVTAGSIASGFAGGEPWGDPIARQGSRSTGIPAVALRAVETTGSHGIVLDRPEVGGVGVWREKTDGTGIAVIAERASGLGITAGWAERTGEGASIRMRAGKAIIRCAAHLPRAVPPSLVLDASMKAEAPGRIRLAWSLRPRADGLQGRVDGATSGRLASFRWAVAGSVLGPGRPGRSPVVMDFGIDREVPGGDVSMSLAWSERPSARFGIARAIPFPLGGLAHLGSTTDLDRSRKPRFQLHLTSIRGGLRLEASPPALGGARSTVGREWKWSVSLEQKGKK
jgi:hypothetical protein